MSFFLILSACKTTREEDSSVPVIGVKTLKVYYSDFVEPVRCTGILSTKMESKLSFKTGGIIDQILADEGQSVKKGQLLAQLNPEEIKSKVRQADLVLKKAERDFGRAKNLYQDSVVTLEQFENAKTALDVAKANDRIARFNLQYSAIHAPADGKILKRVAEINEIIAPGFPVFLFASTQNEWVVRTNLTDRDIIRINMLDSARILFDAYKEEVFMGLVSEVGTAADPYTGTYEVEIQLLRKPRKLVSGFMARINIFPKELKRQIIIPYESILDGVGYTAYVFIIKDGKPYRRKIKIKSFSDKGISVESGLHAGEEIVLEGLQYLREDSSVKIIETVKE